ncbi:MAG: hypothetical protein Tsb0026_05680 [Sulfuricaulis sp.]
MRLTVDKKITLGLAIIAASGILVMVALYQNMTTASQSLLQITATSEPASAATYEMEINVIGIGMGALKYVETGDPKHRRRVEKDDSDFRRFKAAWESLAQTPHSQKLKEIIETQYAEYMILATRILDYRDWRQEVHQRIVDDILRLDKILEKEMLPNMAEKPWGQEKVILLAKMEADVAEVGNLLGVYLAANTPKAELFREVMEFRLHLAELERQPLTVSEAHVMEQVERMFEHTFSLIEQLIARHAAYRSDLNRFVTLRENIDNVLDEEIQHFAAHDLGTAKRAAEKTVENIIYAIAILIPLFLMLVVTIGYYLHRMVMKPLSNLMHGMRSIAAGDLRQRLPITGRDEFTELATQLNKMTDRLETTMVSKTALEESEERLRLLVVGVRDYAIFMLDAEGRVANWNTAGERIYGYTEDDIKGLAFENFYAPEEAERGTPAIALEAIAAHGRFEHDTRMRRKDGAVFDANVVLTSLHDPRGRPSGFTAVCRDITERKRMETELFHRANYDSLTGLPNRVLFSDRLRQAILDAERHDRLVGVAFLDLDRFKNVNDSLGHEIGDLLLKSVAERLTNVLRSRDTVARLSGDEFALVLADMAHMDDARLVAQKIMEAFSTPFHAGGRLTLRITASLGITLFPFDEKEAPSLLRNADSAMYSAKAAGRNTYRFYSAEMTAVANENLSLENDLRGAIERNELTLHYQPLVDITSGHIFGAEALLRWHHDTHGLVMPDKFISLAEESGLIVPIGEWVLRTACTQMQEWRRRGIKVDRITVNLSYVQLSENLAPAIFRLLREAGVEPSSLEIEITESMLMHRLDQSISILKDLRNYGIRVAIDNFGTGYSSLSMLRRLPIDTLKIDRGFVHDIETDSDVEAIVEAIISMAHTLDLRVTAEGVETAAQLERLKTGRCDAYQGYFFSKPVDSDIFTNRYLKS